jgi:glycosyltransferase involved in cell wall biosynthesis
LIDCSVVIATKDRARYLQCALASLLAQRDAPKFEIVVVDNGSTDDTESTVRQFARDAVEVRYVALAQPNRGKARNHGVAATRGRYLLFCDDDVYVPAEWIATHLAAHRLGGERVVNGPILNVPSYGHRPSPRAANYSRAFLCTCNASLSRSAFDRAGGFDESFDLYGWEDTELGVRLRALRVRWTFAWDAYLWHVKPPDHNTLDVEGRKAVEKARMARKFLMKHPSARARFATGAHPLNLVRGKYLLPEWLVALYGGVASTQNVPPWLSQWMRGQFLDALYLRELVRECDAGDVR